MGLFRFLTQKGTVADNGAAAAADNKAVVERDIATVKPTAEATSTPLPEIPEHLFVAYDKPKTHIAMDPNDPPQETNDIYTLYRYLEQNLEKKGYEDALTNPDSSYRDEHVRYIQNELHLMIAKVKTYYGNHLRTINLHIETRRRNGMMELVDELITEKAKVEDEMKIVVQIDEDSRNGNGLTENLFLSYKNGFQSGFAAITYNLVLKRS